MDRGEERGAVAAGRIGLGLAVIAAPLLFAAGLAIHPEETKDAAQQLRIVVDTTGRWNAAHLLLLAAAACFVPATFGIMRLLRERGAWYGLVGGILVVIGAVYVAALVGLDALTLAAFAEVPADQHAGLTPGIQAMLDLRGPAPVVLLGPLGLTIGFVVLGIGLWTAGTAPRWASAAIAVGAAALLVLFLVEASDQALAVPVVVMLIGMVEPGLRLIRQPGPRPVQTMRPATA
jgi:hypothetical protein